MFLLVLGILLFVGLIIVHEFGHFIMARRGGVDVEEFGIGFPPALYRKRVRSSKGDYDFTLNALPLGGFVRLKGETDSDTDIGTYGAASFPTKMKIMSAGVVMNLITAYILFVIAALVGMPKIVDNQFTIEGDTKIATSTLFAGYVEPDSPAAKAGMKAGDRIVSITHNDKTTVMNGTENLPAITERYADKTVAITYVQDGKEQTRNTTLLSKQAVEASRKTGTPKGYLGVAPSSFVIQRSTWSAPIVAGGVIAQFTGLTFQGLGKALAGLGGIIAGFATGNTPARQAAQTEASSQVSGPLGIFFILKNGSTLGYEYVLFIIAIISLTLAIMNFLPIPALDGGRLWLTLLFRAIKKPLTKTIEERVNAVGFVTLMALIVLITIVDFKRFI